MSWLKDKIKTWLEIQEPSPRMYTIHGNTDYQTDCIVNRIWYRGDKNELSEIYKQLQGQRETFWGAVPTAGMEIKKSHTGLPKLIVKTLANIIINDYNGIELKNETYSKYWEEVAKDNNFDKRLKDMVSETIAIGDGALKISFDPTITEYPILEWETGDKVDFIYKRDRLVEMCFKKYYNVDRKVFTLKEIYGYGYVDYKLYDDDKEVSLTSVPELVNLKPIKFDKSVMWAVPLIIDKSTKYEGRGASKFDGKLDIFDSLDEIISQWLEAIRQGRARTYIPEDLIPRDPNTGALLTPNSFDMQFIQTASDLSENGGNKVQVEQAEINSDRYLQSYITYLDLALQGLISPSTLGIDNKKVTDANAAYERQMEKTTLYTRQGIIEALNDFICKVVNTVFKAKEQIKGNVPTQDFDVTVKFGEYNTPSFDFQIDTISKAKMNGIMSMETAIDELYGDSKDEDWKVKEVARLKEEQGIVEMEEPAVNKDADNIDIEDEDVEDEAQE